MRFGFPTTPTITFFFKRKERFRSAVKILVLAHVFPRVLHERETSTLHVENGNDKRKNWREKMLM